MCICRQTYTLAEFCLGVKLVFITACRLDYKVGKGNDSVLFHGLCRAFAFPLFIQYLAHSSYSINYWLNK